MGVLIHGSVEVEFDDRLLAHMQVIIVTHFRRGESIVVSWLNALSVGDGRSSMWMTPEQPVFFRFSGSRPVEIDRSWLRVLDQSVSSPTGMVLTDVNGKTIRAGAIRRHA
jgi:hypothetical protein